MPRAPEAALSPLLSFITRPRVVTIALAAAGTAVFGQLGLPLPFLFGPMAATLIAALSRVRLAGMGPLGTAARSVIGVTVGSTVTPTLVDTLPQVAGSLLIMPLYLMVIGAVGVPFLRRVHKLDPVTAFYGAMPGGLQDMVSFGQEAGGDVRALSLIQATRVLILVAVAPPILVLIYDAPLTAPIGVPAADVPWREIALMVFAAAAGTIGGRRIGLFGAPILGPLLLTSAFTLAGLIESRPPREVILGSQFIIGMTIGVYYMGLTLRELRAYVLSGVAYSILLAVLTAIFAEAVTLLGLARPLEAFLAFAPGGGAELTLLAFAVGADVTYVVPHQLVRSILVIAGAPLAWRLAGLARRPRRD